MQVEPSTTSKNTPIVPNKLKLKKFDMSMIKSNNTVIQIAMRGTGKSFVEKDLLQMAKKQ